MHIPRITFTRKVSCSRSKIGCRQLLPPIQRAEQGRNDISGIQARSTELRHPRRSSLSILLRTIRNAHLRGFLGCFLFGFRYRSLLYRRNFGRFSISRCFRRRNPFRHWHALFRWWTLRCRTEVFVRTRRLLLRHRDHDDLMPIRQSDDGRRRRRHTKSEELLRKAEPADYGSRYVADRSTCQRCDRKSEAADLACHTDHLIEIAETVNAEIASFSGSRPRQERRFLSTARIGTTHHALEVPVIVCVRDLCFPHLTSRFCSSRYDRSKHECRCEPFQCSMHALFPF